LKFIVIASPLVKQFFVVAILSQHFSTVGSGVGYGVGLGVGPGVGTGVGLGVVLDVGLGVGSGVGKGVGSGIGGGETDGKFVGDALGSGTGVGPAVPTDSQFVQQEQNTCSQSASRISSSKEHKSTGITPLNSVTVSFTSASSFKRSIGGRVPVKSLSLRSSFIRFSIFEMP